MNEKIASQAGMSCSPGAGSGQTGQTRCPGLELSVFGTEQERRSARCGEGINHKKPDKKVRSDRKEKK